MGPPLRGLARGWLLSRQLQMTLSRMSFIMLNHCLTKSRRSQQRRRGLPREAEPSGDLGGFGFFTKRLPQGFHLFE